MSKQLAKWAAGQMVDRGWDLDTVLRFAGGTSQVSRADIMAALDTHPQGHTVLQDAEELPPSGEAATDDLQKLSKEDGDHLNGATTSNTSALVPVESVQQPRTSARNTGSTRGSWTDERVESLRKLWAEGLSASQIAVQLGGLTRNAVIGKIHRLNLAGRAKPASSTPRPRKVRAASPRRPSRSHVSGNTSLQVHAHPAPRRQLPAPIPIEDLVVPISLKVSLLELDDQVCKWPIGDPGHEEFHFCGHRNFGKLPYCEYHSRLAYQPPNDRRRDRDRAAA